MLPESISDPSPLDPLIVLPVPDPLPSSPASQLEPLGQALEAYLANDPQAFPGPALVAQMRMATRDAQVHLNTGRFGAAQARHELDKRDVELRTAEYELARVREEMELCRAYEPIYESLDLPSEADFLMSASPEVLASLPPEDAEARQYALIIARLEAELAAITAREAKVAELNKERDSLVRSRRDIGKKFETVDVFLNDFAKTSKSMGTKIRDLAAMTRDKPEKPKESQSEEKKDDKKE